jgi:hypothetical protein
MDPRQAKLQTLQDLIGAMDDHMLGPVAAKAQAKAAPTPPAAPAVAAAAAPAEAKPDDALDADAAAKLRKLYEEEDATPPVPVAGSY